MGLLYGLIYNLKFFRRYWKNVFVLVLAVTVSFSMILTVDYLVDSTYSTFSGLDSNYRLSQIVVKSYPRFFNGTLMEDISTVRGVEGVEGFVNYFDFFSVNNETVLVNIYGVPKNPNVDKIPGIDWEHFNGFVVFVDEGIAERNNLKLGDTVKLLNHSFTIMGVGSCVWAPSFKYSSTGFFLIPLETMWSILGVENAYNEIRVRVATFSEIGRVAYEIYSLIREKGLDGYVTIRPVNFMQLLTSLDPILYLARLITLLIILSTIGFYVYIDLRRRIKEFGVLQSIGLSQKSIVLLVVTQVLLILLLSMIIAIPLSVTLAYKIIMGISYLPSISVKINIFTFNAILDLIIVTIASTIVSLKLASSLRIRPLNELIKFGDIDVKPARHLVFKSRFLGLNYTLRSIFNRKLRSTALILLVALSISLSSSFITLSNQAYSEHVRMLNEDMRWDIMVQLENPLNLPNLTSYLDSIDSVNYTEKLVIAPLPVLTVGSKEKTIEPPYNSLLVIGMNGNETLIKFRYVEGQLSSKGVVITKKIAELFDLHVGDRLVLKVLHPLGTTMGTDVLVTGIIDSSYNGGWLILFHLSVLKNNKYNISVNPNVLLVKVKNGYGVESTGEEIYQLMVENRFFGQVTTKSKAVNAVREYYRNVNYILDSIIGILVFGVAVSVAMIFFIDMYNRRYELALNKVFGGTVKKALSLLAPESVVLTFLGVMLAVPIYGVSLYFMVSWLNYSPLDIWLPFKLSFEVLINVSFIVALVAVATHVAAISYYFKKSGVYDLSEKY